MSEIALSFIAQLISEIFISLSTVNKFYKFTFRIHCWTLLKFVAEVIESQI